jgi:hypothetical protein
VLFRSIEYTAGRVVYRPRRMTPDRLQAMYEYAWDTFYAGSGHQIKMGQLFASVLRREILDGTSRRFAPAGPRAFRDRRGAP